MAPLNQAAIQKLDELATMTLKGLRDRDPPGNWEHLQLKDQLDVLYARHEFLKSMFKTVTVAAFELCAKLVDESPGCPTCEENVKKIRALKAALREGDLHGSEKGDSES